MTQPLSADQGVHVLGSRNATPHAKLHICMHLSGIFVCIQKHAKLQQSLFRNQNNLLKEHFILKETERHFQEQWHMSLSACEGVDTQNLNRSAGHAAGNGK